MDESGSGLIERGGEGFHTSDGSRPRGNYGSPGKRLSPTIPSASTQPCGLIVLVPCLLVTLLGMSYLGGNSYSYLRSDKATLAAINVNPDDSLCLHDVEYKDFGTRLPNTDKYECAATCRDMPNCKVWEMIGRDCMVRFGNNTALPTKGKKACLQVKRPEKDYSSMLGVAHWQGCYFKSDAPYLLDGAKVIRNEIGSKVIKVSLNFHEPWNDYAWNSKWPKEEWKDWTPPPVEVVQHQYFKDLFEMDFDTYILIAFSNVARSITGPYEWKSWMDPWYWVYKEPTPQQLRDETEQFAKLTEYLLTHYKNKTFILQMWEGDWELRQGLVVEDRQNPEAQVPKQAADSMVSWLTARQKGVTQARKEVGDKTTSKVYHAAEVNVVRETLSDLKKFPVSRRNDMINSVIPRVALDMVSYSAYDTALTPGKDSLYLFRDALRLIKRRHIRTEASPPQAVYVGEFGVSTMNTDWDDTMERVKAVYNLGLAEGLAYIIYWQVYDNVLNQLGKEYYGVDKCTSDMVAKGPVYDQAYIQGFFLMHPDFLYWRPQASYLIKLIEGNVKEV